MASETPRIPDIQVGQLTRADGSSIFVSPEAVLQCAIYGPVDVPFHKEMPDKATIDIVLKTGAKSKECPPDVKADQEFIRNLFESVIMVDLYPRSGIEIIVQEMESENGHILSPAINCITAALLDAGLSLSSTVASITSVISEDRKVIVDPDKLALENSSTKLLIVFESVDCNIIAIKSYGQPFEMSMFKECLRLSKQSAKEMFANYRNLMINNIFVDSNN